MLPMYLLALHLLLLYVLIQVELLNSYGIVSRRMFAIKKKKLDEDLNGKCDKHQSRFILVEIVKQ